MNTEADLYFKKAKKWQEEQKQLRAIVLDCGLTEEFKWMHPCYTFQGNNIVLIHAFKDYCALLFHKGALLKDPKDILVQQTENVQAARQLRFSSVQEIMAQKTTIKEYIREAIEVEKSGKEVDFKKTSEFQMPEEFQEALDDDPALKETFKDLTQGRQRGYLLYFGGAKQSKTRKARIERYRQRIMDKKGINDRED